MAKMKCDVCGKNYQARKWKTECELKLEELIKKQHREGE